MKITTIPETMTPHEAMIHAADTAVAGTGDGRISKDDADALIDIYHKNPDESTMHSLKHVRNNYKWTRAAAEHLASVVPSFSIFPIPAPDIFGVGRNQLGVVAVDDDVHIFCRGAATNYIYQIIWNPFTGKTSVSQLMAPNGKGTYCTSWGMSAEVLEDGTIYLLCRGETDTGVHDYTGLYAFHIKDGIKKHTQLGKEKGWTTPRAPSTTLLGQTVYLTWIDYDTNNVCLASHDTIEGDYNLLFNSIAKAEGSAGHEKTNYTPALFPVLINEDDGNGGLVFRQKIMVVWQASEQGGITCCTFYDTSSGKLSEVQVAKEGFLGPSTIAKNERDNTLRVLGTTYPSGDSNRFATAVYDINQNSAGGNWYNRAFSTPADGDFSEYGPTFLEYGSDMYAFVIEKGTNKITYQKINYYVK